MSGTVPSETLRPSLATLLERLGGISPARIPCPPAPGTATEADLFLRPGGEKRLYELVDGVLVEKPMGYYESILAAILIRWLGEHADHAGAGIVLGPDATLRLAHGLVRLPDVSFISWERFPGRRLPRGALLGVAPDLAVEILSPGNTRGEMERKLREYFAAGTTMVWYVDPEARTVRVYTAPRQGTLLTEADSLDGGKVLPGFAISIREWFEKAGPRE